MKNVPLPLAKNILMPLGLSPAVSASDAAIQMKNDRSLMAKPMISNEEMKLIKKIVKSLEESSLLIKI